MAEQYYTATPSNGSQFKKNTTFNCRITYVPNLVYGGVTFDFIAQRELPFLKLYKEDGSVINYIQRLYYSQIDFGFAVDSSIISDDVYKIVCVLGIMDYEDNEGRVFRVHPEDYEFTSFDIITTPYLTKPTESYFNTKDNIEVSWSFLYGTQSHYAIEFLTDGVWEVFGEIQASSDTTAFVLASELGGGSFTLRVGISNDGINFKYTESAQFIIEGAPTDPIFTDIENKTRPLISWSSVGQVSFVLKILQGETVIADSGIQFGEVQSYKFKEFLENGDYTAELVITNVYNINSNIVTKNFAIDIPKILPEPSIQLNNIDYGIKIKTELTSNTLYLFINDKMVQSGKNIDTFYDYSNIKENSYRIRVVDEFENFSDSIVLTAETEIKYATLAIAENPSDYLILFLRRNQPVSKAKVTNYEVTQLMFSGRVKPCFEFGEKQIITHNFAYSVRTMDDFTAVQQMLNKQKTLLFRNNFGVKVYGVVTGIEINYDKNGVDFNLSIAETDFNEVIDYEI